MKRSKIARAMDHISDDLIEEAIDGNCAATPPNTGGIIMKNNHQWKKWTAIAAAVVLMLTGAVVLTGVIRAVSSTVIALDVNPSLEIEVNGRDRVKEIRALNEEAVIVIGDMDFKDVDLDVAVNALIGSMLQKGYLSTDQNSILISVDAKNEKTAAALKESISADISALLQNSNIEASIITQTFDKSPAGETSADGISAARAALIDKIIASGLTDAEGAAYTYERLSGLKVHELKLILESKSQTVAGIEASGTASEGGLIGKDRALAIALEEAGVTQADATRIEVEIDVSKKTQTIFYEVEFRVGTVKYEYELIATTGEIVEKEMEHDDDDDRPVNDKIDGDMTTGDRYISIEEATAIAYAHAGVTSGRDLDRELKTENGRTVYEVEFEIDRRDYDYVIDAESGAILRARVPADASDPTLAKAEALALDHAGVDRASITSMESYVEYRDGIQYAYRIDFETKRDMEYEYVINAAGDTILDSRADD